MGKPITDDELWALIESLLPPARVRRFRYPGRKPLPNGAALTGILFVLRAGIRWRDLPAEASCGSGVSRSRKLRDWQQAGAWDQLHAPLLERLRAANQIDFSGIVSNFLSIQEVGAHEKLIRTRPMPHDPVPDIISPRTRTTRRSQQSGAAPIATTSANRFG